MSQSTDASEVRAFTPEEPPAPSLAWGNDREDEASSRASNIHQEREPLRAGDRVHAPAGVEARPLPPEGAVGVDDDTTSESDDDEVPLDAQGQLLIPRIQDSEEHDVKFLGRLTINGTRENPPSVSSCTTAIKFLRKVSARRRQQFCGSVTAPQIIKISANLGRAVCRPKDPATNSSGLVVNLAEVTCVSYVQGDMCFVTGRMYPSGDFKFFAYAFSCGSALASQYLAQEILRACRHVFMIRRMQRSRNAIIAANERQQAQIRQREAQLAQQQGGPPPVAPAPPAAAPTRPSPTRPLAANAPATPAPVNEAVASTPQQPVSRAPTVSDRYFYKERNLIMRALAGT
eukprot:m.225690 g.225690  ORF g.225690 m.225690 type:complete len:345 (+) comp19212_c0_seq1:222-1256(+)